MGLAKKYKNIKRSCDISLKVQTKFYQIEKLVLQLNCSVLAKNPEKCKS